MASSSSRSYRFELSGAPSSFQRLMDKLIKGCEGFASAYLDDLVVFSNSWQEHLSVENSAESHQEGWTYSKSIWYKQICVLCTSDTWLVMEAWSQS